MTQAAFLYTLFVKCGMESYTMQMHAPSAPEAIRAYFKNNYARSTAIWKNADAPPVINDNDIHYVQHMDGLQNAWVCSAGSEGKYVSVVCVQTAF